MANIDPNGIATEPAEPTEPTEPKEPTEPAEPPAKTYTDEEVNEIIKGKIARERSKWEQEIERQKAEATEAEKLKNMNDLERAEHEREKFFQENEQLRRELNIRQQMDVSRDTLAEAGIHFPDELLSQFVTDNAEDTKAAVDAVIKQWSKCVEQRVKEELRGTPPKNPNPTGAKAPSAGALFAQNYSKKMKEGK